MKYIVDVNGERHEVELGAGGLTIAGEAANAHLAAVDGTPVHVLSVDDEVHSLLVRAHQDRGRYTVWLDGYRYEVEALDERTRAIRDLDVAREVAAGPAPLRAPMPGLVVRVLVSEGDRVEAGQGLVVVEAMKMENELRAGGAGRVKRISAQPGMAVEKGAVLVELD